MTTPQLALIIVLALASLLAGVALWVWDARRAQNARIATKSQSQSQPQEQAQPGAKPKPEPGSEPNLGPEPQAGPKPEPEPEPPLEPELVDKHDSAEDKRARARKPLLSFGRRGRERKAWAQEREFEYLKRDEYLADEFHRGVAAHGAEIKDIVRGHAFGYELLIMDIGSTPVLAMRRGASSDVVVDARRRTSESQASGAPAGAGSDDLLFALNSGQFAVYSTEVGVAQRSADTRFHTALEHLPQAVTAVWMEGDWVLAQLTEDSSPEDWDSSCASLALLCAAARTLPPLTGAAQPLPVEDLDPTRRMQAQPGPEFSLVTEGVKGAQGIQGTQGGLAVISESPPTVFIQRPEEPIALPSRAHRISRGMVAPPTVGSDEVIAIGEGEENSTKTDAEERGTRMPRDLSRGPSIFGDSTP